MTQTMGIAIGKHELRLTALNEQGETTRYNRTGKMGLTHGRHEHTTYI